MNPVLGIGAGIVFRKGFQDFLQDHFYAVVAYHVAGYKLVEISLTNRAAARFMRFLPHATVASLREAGIVTVNELPSIPSPQVKPIAAIANTGTSDTTTSAIITERLCWLQPLLQAKEAILSADDPVKYCNKVARQNKLNCTRARTQFFWLAAYGFEAEALTPAYYNSGSSQQDSSERDIDGDDSPAPIAQAKRGPKVHNPDLTMQGWAFDRSWESKILRGWKIHMQPGRTYTSAYVGTLRTEFECSVDKNSEPVHIFHPDHKSFPTFKQFSHFLIKTLGKAAWIEAKYGAGALRYGKGVTPYKTTDHLINLLEELQWDGQVLQEVSGDFLDPTQRGKHIVRVQVTCGTCGGPVGVGYSYGGESRWAYLMALLSMAMKKSEFCALFGVDVSDDSWPSIGLPLSTRGDRGPAIASPVSDIVGDVLKIWQEWAPSYDALDKATVEAGHYKQPIVRGAPVRATAYRSPFQIIRDDLRKTEKLFQTRDMSDRLDPEQAKKMTGTPRNIWKDLVTRGLYAGRNMPYEKLIPLTLPRFDVSITENGVDLGGAHYLSNDLIESGLLERARGGAIPSHAYAMLMGIKHIWLDLGSHLMKLTAIPAHLNHGDAIHTLTLDESHQYLNQINQSRRAVEQEQLALEMAIQIDREKDDKAIEQARQRRHARKSTGKAETVQQHEHVFKQNKS